ncbi:MAG TPA: LPS-assembly protein LptD [Candidatus Aminicenantes bacterium]|nr:LPS-assembly protein LptD [Candidatus Aminicenantes bacterium]HEB36454.1 LPS-assembly protein LptD [Candidatus Aminicenantes bacterium]
MSRNKAAIFLIVCIFFTGSFLFGQKEDSSSEPITIIANYKEKIKEMVFAKGNVEIHYKDVKLFADSAELNTETKDVYAVGNVLIQLPEEVVSAEEIRMNLDSLQGNLQKGFGMIQPTLFYEAENIERKDAGVYYFQKAKITSCTQPVPRWKISSSRAKFKKNDYIDMWNPVFYIKKIPIFYLPYMRYPLDEERSTGFLMPQIGFSGSKGFSYSQFFYWAMKRNMDATLNFDYYAARGLGGGFEYRYLFSGGVGGQLNLYYFNFKDDPEEESTANAYLFRLKHNQRLPLNFSLVADVDYSSSFDFLREFDNDFKRAVVSNRRSQVYLTKAWSYFNFNARISRFETYYKETDRSIIRNDLPEINFDSYKIKIFSPLYFSFASSFSRWEYGWESEYEEENQKYSQSVAFSPKLTFPFTAIPWLTLNSSFSPNINYYFQSYAPNTQEIVDEPLFSLNYGLNAEFTGPVISKIYYGAEGKAKLKHIIEPFFSYRYESPVADSDRIITQRIFYRNHYIRYGIANRFLIKKDKMPREVFSLGLVQTFYFSPEESPLQGYRVDGEIPEFSDIRGYLRFYPMGKYSLDVSAAFNPYHNTFSSLSLGANLGSPEDNVFLRVNWYKSINPYVENILGDRHQISCFGGVKIPRLSLEAQAEIDFNIQEGEFLYSAISLVYNYQCFDFRVELKVFYFREKPETQFLFSFGLGNIGKTIDFLGGMGF